MLEIADSFATGWHSDHGQLVAVGTVANGRPWHPVWRRSSLSCHPERDTRLISGADRCSRFGKWCANLWMLDRRVRAIDAGRDRGGHRAGGGTVAVPALRTGRRCWGRRRRHRGPGGRVRWPVHLAAGIPQRNSVLYRLYLAPDLDLLMVAPIARRLRRQGAAVQPWRRAARDPHRIVLAWFGLARDAGWAITSCSRCCCWRWSCSSYRDEVVLLTTRAIPAARIRT